MITTKQMRHARVQVLAVSLVSMFATSCAAPDAQPAPPDEPVVTPPINGGQVDWALGLGEATADQHAYDVALNPAANTFVTTMGFFTGIVIPGVMPVDTFTSLGSRNIVVVSYAATGSQPLWAAQIGSTSEIVRAVVDIDFQGNTIVAGGFYGKLEISGLTAVDTLGVYDAYITKLDPNGKPLWVRSFGNVAEQFITDVATDGEGNIIVVGFARGIFDFGPGVPAAPAHGDDIFVAKFDSAGEPIWGKRVGKAGSIDWFDPTATVAVSRTDGSIIVGGTHSDTLKFPPEEIPSFGKEDGFVVKLDAQGNGIWHKAFGTKDRRQRVAHVAYDARGEVLLTGSFSGSVSLDENETQLKGYLETSDLLVAKLNAKGEHVWSRGYGHDGNQLGNHVSFDDVGNAVVIGTFEGVIDLFGASTIINANVQSTFGDVFAAKFSSNGTPLWGRAYGDSGLQQTGGAVLWKTANDEDRAIIVGRNNGTIPLQAPVSSLATQGFEDAFIMSIAH